MVIDSKQGWKHVVFGRITTVTNAADICSFAEWNKIFLLKQKNEPPNVNFLQSNLSIYTSKGVS